MSRFTLAKDFRNIDAMLARVILIESGPRILPMFLRTNRSLFEAVSARTRSYENM